MFNARVLPVILRLVFAGALILPPIRAIAGHDVGNGGRVVVCPKDTGRAEVELLDYYEGKLLRSWTPELGSSAEYLERVDGALERLAKRSPRRAARYRGWLRDFASEAQYPHGQVLVPVDDSDHATEPRGCVVVQAVNQNTNPLPGNPRYIVNGDLWDKMGTETRAGLVLHELIYRETLAEGHDNSIAARYFNSLVSSDVYSRLSFESLYKIHLALRIPLIEFGPFEVRAFGCYYPQPYQKACGTGSVVSNEYPIAFYPDGNIQSWEFSFWNDMRELNLGPTKISFGPYVANDADRFNSIELKNFDSPGLAPQSLESRSWKVLLSDGTLLDSPKKVSFRPDGTVERVQEVKLPNMIYKGLDIWPQGDFEADANNTIPESQRFKSVVWADFERNNRHIRLDATTFEFSRIGKVAAVRVAQTSFVSGAEMSIKVDPGDRLELFPDRSIHFLTARQDSFVEADTRAVVDKRVTILRGSKVELWPVGEYGLQQVRSFVTAVEAELSGPESSNPVIVHPGQRVSLDRDGRCVRVTRP